VADNERLNAEVARLSTWKEDADKALREEWRQRLLAFITGDGLVCVYCMEMTHDPYHWKACPKHPARAEVERLQAELATAKLQLADCMGDLSLSAEFRLNLQAEVKRLEQHEQSLTRFLEEAAFAVISGAEPTASFVMQAPTALRDEIERLRVALGHYADKSKWKEPFDDEYGWFLTDDPDEPWQFAQNALAGQVGQAAQP